MKKLVWLLVIAAAAVFFAVVYVRIGSSLVKAQASQVGTGVDLIKDVRSRIDSVNRMSERQERAAREALEQ